MSCTILIVEDDEELQDLYSAMLAELDCRIVRAYDGGQAVALLEKVSPDLILLDMLLDEMMGDEVFFHIRRDERYADVPVVIASVLAKERCQHLLDRDQRTMYLRKPFRKAQLASVIQSGLSEGGWTEGESREESNGEQY